MAKKRVARTGSRHPVKRKYGKPDVSEWLLDAIGEMSDLLSSTIAKAVNEAIAVAMEDETTGVSWAAEWSDANGLGDGHTSDHQDSRFVPPLAIYLSIALGNNADENVVYEFDLRESLSETIAFCRDDGSFSDGLTRIMNALRELANEIESALPDK